MRKPGLDERVEDCQVPAVSQHLPPVLPPSKVVRPNLTVGLKGGRALLDQPHMVDQQDCRQKQRSNVDGPKEYCHLGVNC